MRRLNLGQVQPLLPLACHSRRGSGIQGMFKGKDSQVTERPTPAQALVALHKMQ
jgi:hypothetical protein